MGCIQSAWNHSMVCQTKCQVLLDIFNIHRVFPKTDVQPIFPPFRCILLNLTLAGILLNFTHLGHHVWWLTTFLPDMSGKMWKSLKIVYIFVIFVISVISVIFVIFLKSGKLVYHLLPTAVKKWECLWKTIQFNIALFREWLWNLVNCLFWLTDWGG